MTFKVMTWNVENLFRSGSAFGPKTKAIYTEKLDGLATIIDQEAPDALAVQEVGDPKALTALVNRLDGDWHQRVSRRPGRSEHPRRVAHPVGHHRPGGHH
jgi:hypothetical protein